VNIDAGLFVDLRAEIRTTADVANRIFKEVAALTDAYDKSSRGAAELNTCQEEVKVAFLSIKDCPEATSKDTLTLMELTRLLDKRGLAISAAVRPELAALDKKLRAEAIEEFKLQKQRAASKSAADETQAALFAATLQQTNAPYLKTVEQAAAHVNNMNMPMEAAQRLLSEHASDGAINADIFMLLFLMLMHLPKDNIAYKFACLTVRNKGVPDPVVFSASQIKGDDQECRDFTKWMDAGVEFVPMVKPGIPEFAKIEQKAREFHEEYYSAIQEHKRQALGMGMSGEEVYGGATEMHPNPFAAAQAYIVEQALRAKNAFGRSALRKRLSDLMTSDKPTSVTGSVEGGEVKQFGAAETKDKIEYWVDIWDPSGIQFRADFSKLAEFLLKLDGRLRNHTTLLRHMQETALRIMNARAAATKRISGRGPSGGEAKPAHNQPKQHDEYDGMSNAKLREMLRQRSRGPVTTTAIPTQAASPASGFP
jgi:hypothetical protein